jgi:hypothetical protein
LRQCESCRELSRFWRQSGAGEQQLILAAPEDLVHRNRAVVRLVESRNPGRTIRADVISDSWGLRPAVVLRDTASDIERRLRFQAAGFTFEFVANRHLAEWDFVARVYQGGKVSREFVLQIGSRKLPTGRGDCYFWRSSRPPCRLQLLSRDLRIDLGRLQW